MKQKIDARRIEDYRLMYRYSKVHTLCTTGLN